ncbi:MAG: type II toxin-antitoxin system VapB family antitoxin [Paucibacter sp.]|nr:type II toxin-antitoxin system VapB family antitoxin [Roseateles sp.]
MRTNIEIDDQLMAEVMAGGAFKTKKEAVEAGLRLLKRQAAMRELLQMRGKVRWGWGDEERLDGKPNWSVVEPEPAEPALQVSESSPAYEVKRASAATRKSKPAAKGKTRARR